MSTPYLRMNQRIRRVVRAPRDADATPPAKFVNACLGSAYCSRTRERSDTSTRAERGSGILWRGWSRRASGLGGHLGDVGDEARPELARQVVTHAVDEV